MTPPASAPGVVAPEPARLLAAVTELARELHVEVGEAELVARFAGRQAAAGAPFAVRVVDALREIAAVARRRRSSRARRR
ncbi:MAG: hypothetical protein R2939_20570 [Kofleriaceae bacterium]